MLLLAQAPQGFTYQGVATDNNGFELQNQSISIQASILSSSATGTTVWQETHNTTTDTFGLFNVTIGEGTSTNGGSSATFSEIDWGAASHFMKVEIGVNGGTNYVHAGTSQMMSVPYALYAENINMDSTFMANVGASIDYDRGFRDAFSIYNSSQWCHPYQQVITLDSISNINNEVIYEIDYSLSAGYASGCGIEISLINQDNVIIPILVNTSNHNSFSNSFQRTVWYSSTYSERIFIKAYPEIGSTIYLQLDILGEISIGSCTSGCNYNAGNACNGASFGVSGIVILH